MGQKVNPISLRTPIDKKWDSKSFFPHFNYASLLHQDIQIQRYIYGILFYFNILCNRCVIKRINNCIYINVYLYLRTSGSNIKTLTNLLCGCNKGVKKVKPQKTKLKPSSIKGKSFFSLLNIVENSLTRLTSSKVVIRFFPLYSITKKKYNRSFLYLSRSLRFLNSISFLHIFDLAISTKNSKLLSQFIALNLHAHIRNVRFFLRFIDRIMGLFMSHYGCRGIKISIKGRLNGARRARVIVIQKGKIPLNTLSSKISYGFCNAMTIYGLCSIKVWLHL
jgi:ribosomal protein S3